MYKLIPDMFVSCRHFKFCAENWRFTIHVKSLLGCWKCWVCRTDNSAYFACVTQAFCFDGIGQNPTEQTSATQPRQTKAPWKSACLCGWVCSFVHCSVTSHPDFSRVFSPHFSPVEHLFPAQVVFPNKLPTQTWRYKAETATTYSSEE